MSRKLLLDTNILLDIAICERSNWGAATLLIDEFAFGNAEGYVSALSLKDVYYILTKYTNEASARDFVKAIADAFVVLPVDEALCRLAILSDEPDFEDGLIRACAENASVDFIISRDSDAFASSSIRRLSAQEYLELFCDVETVDLPSI